MILEWGIRIRKKPKAKKGLVTWHFIAPQVHDFTWAADPEYYVTMTLTLGLMM